MFKSISFLISLLLIIIVDNVFFALIILVISITRFLVLSGCKIDKLKRLKIPIIIYTLIAIINYLFNQLGMVKEVFGIYIYIDTLRVVLLLWLKLVLISLEVINLTQFQSDKELLWGMTKLFSFLKIFKIKPLNISKQIVLMLVFLDKILHTINIYKKDKSSVKKKSEKNKIELNFIDKIVKIIKLSLEECRLYYKQNIEFYDNQDFQNVEGNSIRSKDFIFLSLYIIILFLYCLLFDIINYSIRI